MVGPTRFQWRSGALGGGDTQGFWTPGAPSATPDPSIPYFALEGDPSTLSAPVASAQPNAATDFIDKADRVFTFIASGFPAPTYQWEENTGSGWSNATGGSGSTTPNFTAPTATVALDGIQYRCVATNSQGSVTSSAVTWRVLPFRLLTESGSTTDGSGFNGASITVAVNRLGLVNIVSQGVATTDRAVPSSVSIGAAGLVLVSQVNIDTFTVESVWRCLSTSGAISGVLNIAYTGVTQDTVAWSAVEVEGVDTTGTNGSGAIGTPSTNSGTGTALSVGSIADPGAAGQWLYAAWGWGDPNAATTEIHREGTGLLERSESFAIDSAYYCAQGVDAGVKASSVAATLTGSEAWSGIAFVVNEIGTGGGTAVDVSDSATGSDAVTVAPEIAGADAGTGGDSASLAPAISDADSATGADAAATDVALATQADTAAGSDTATPAPSISGTDTSSGSDQAQANAAAGVSDSATGADTSTPAPELAAADAGAGSDASEPAVSLELTDSASGTDQVSVTENETPVGVSDSGSGSDSVAVEAALVATDTASGGDAPSTAVETQAPDTASGGDAPSTAVETQAPDTASGGDAVSVDTSGAQQVGVSDAGQGADGISIEKIGEGLDVTLIGRNVRFKPLKKPLPSPTPKVAAPSPLIRALVERAKPRSTGMGEIVAPTVALPAPEVVLPEVLVVAPARTEPPAAAPPAPEPPEAPQAAAPPAPKPKPPPKPIKVEMVSVPRAAWETVTADVQTLALQVTDLETQLTQTKEQLAKARRRANQAQAELVALQLLEE